MQYEKSNLNHIFLQQLTKIPSPVHELWQIGQLPDRGKVVSIVGARRSTPYGENIAYKLAYELAKRGVVIVSGLAYGIDACAHRGCLDAGGITVAVLGTPIDKIYPTQNTGLAKRIIEKGAILSEYPPGTETKNWHFLERNRIVSGLSDALIVAEAAQRSGTHQTADDALGQNIDVYAVPGDIFRPSSAGCNRLIYEGAHPITSVDDFLLDFLGAGTQKEFRYDLVISDMADSAKQIVAALKDGLTTAEEIMTKYQIDVAELNRQTMLLQLRGIVQPCGPSAWILK